MAKTEPRAQGDGRRHHSTDVIEKAPPAEAVEAAVAPKSKTQTRRQSPKDASHFEAELAAPYQGAERESTAAPNEARARKNAAYAILDATDLARLIAFS
jgi:hypothetical protein